MSDRVLLDYGSGGRASQRLVSELFIKNFDNEELSRLNDAALLDISGPIAMSTDSYTVDPIFFPGGDIGSLAVHGTVNDVSMLGAVPRITSYNVCYTKLLRSRPRPPRPRGGPRPVFPAPSAPPGWGCRFRNNFV